MASVGGISARDRRVVPGGLPRGRRIRRGQIRGGRTCRRGPYDDVFVERRSWPRRERVGFLLPRPARAVDAAAAQVQLVPVGVGRGRVSPPALVIFRYYKHVTRYATCHTTHTHRYAYGLVLGASVPATRISCHLPPSCSARCASDVNVFRHNAQCGPSGGFSFSRPGAERAERPSRTPLFRPSEDGPSSVGTVCPRAAALASRVTRQCAFPFRCSSSCAWLVKSFAHASQRGSALRFARIARRGGGWQTPAAVRVCCFANGSIPETVGSRTQTPALFAAVAANPRGLDELAFGAALGNDYLGEAVALARL